MSDGIFSSGGMSPLPPGIWIPRGTLSVFDLEEFDLGLVLICGKGSPTPGAVDIQEDQINLDLRVGKGDLLEQVDLLYTTTE